jgi:hypothetical protein
VTDLWWNDKLVAKLGLNQRDQKKLHMLGLAGGKKLERSAIGSFNK